MLTNTTKKRTHVNTELYVNNILLKITSADRGSNRNEDND